MNDIDPRIIDYYDGNLSPEENAKFISELNENADLKRDWTFYGQVIEGIKSEGALELKEYIKEHVKHEALESQSNLWMYAAASVTFLLLSYFAIYSYLETGNIKEAAEIITLKDEKSDKFKFWKKNKSKYPLNTEDSARYYQDSLLALELGRSRDSLLPAEVIADNDLELYEEDYSQKDLKEMSQSGSEPNLAMGAETNPAILITQVTLIPIKLKLDPLSSEGARDKRLTPAVQKNNQIQESLKLKKKEADNTAIVSRVDSSILVAKPTGKTMAVTKFKLIHFEDQRATMTATVNRVGTEMHISLYNIWGENPLVYDIEGAYYIDFGADRIWKIPDKAGIYRPITWIKNTDIIERIRN